MSNGELAKCYEACPEYPHTHINLTTGEMYPSEVSPSTSVWLPPLAVDPYPTLVSGVELSDYMGDDDD